MYKFSLGIFQFVFNLILTQTISVSVQSTTSLTSNFMIYISLFHNVNDLSIYMSAHNERGHPISADIKLLLTLRYFETGTFQQSRADLCEISQPSASRIIKRISEAIAHLENNYIQC